MSVAIAPTGGVDLLSSAMDGDARAFTLLMRSHDQRLRRLAAGLLADSHQVDDTLQEAYVKAWQQLPRFRREADLGTWLYRITYNACMDELRRNRRRPTPVATGPATGPVPVTVSTAPGPERQVTASHAVAQALAALPDDQRVTVVLVDGEGYDHPTAARILGVAPGTVASRLFRARAALRAALGEEAR